MKKRKVIQFIVVFSIFFFSLLFLQVFYHGRLVGLSVASPALTYGVSTSDLVISLVSYKQSDDSLIVTYVLQDGKGVSRPVTLTSTLMADDGSWIVRGAYDVVISASSQKSYLLVMELPHRELGKSELRLAASDGENTAEIVEPLMLSQPSLTGFATLLSSQKKAFRWGMTILFLAGLLFFFIFFQRYHRKALQHQTSPSRQRLIFLDLKS